MNNSKLCLVWHGHHECDLPMEILDESFESRLETINFMKSETESKAQITLRIKLFQPVTGELPASIKKWIEAKYGWKLGWKKTWQVERAEQAAAEDILKLHAEQCDCSWAFQEKNIFWYAVKDLRI